MLVTGTSGRGGLVSGIVDSGADSTSLPFGYAPLLGYTTATLQDRTFVQAGGTGTASVALQPCKMYVPEIPGSVIEFYPQFIQGSQMVLWGRQDFMNRF